MTGTTFESGSQAQHQVGRRQENNGVVSPEVYRIDVPGYNAYVVKDRNDNFMIRDDGNAPAVSLLGS